MPIRRECRTWGDRGYPPRLPKELWASEVVGDLAVSQRLKGIGKDEEHGAGESGIGAKKYLSNGSDWVARWRGGWVAGQLRVERGKLPEHCVPLGKGYGIRTSAKWYRCPLDGPLNPPMPGDLPLGCPQTWGAAGGKCRILISLSSCVCTAGS